ncbi:MAG: hypothetical protein AAF449_11040 [Myxococcota bacterium]
MTLNLKNSALLELSTFVVATESNRAAFDLNPFGLRIHSDHCIDPLKMASATFLNLIRRVDQVAFGPEGMPMPRWIFFDGAELPGGIAGFGIAANRLDEPSRQILAVPEGYDGIVPLSMFIAIPTFESGVWMAHNLCSSARAFPQGIVGIGLQGLGGLSKAIGLRVFRASAQVGATQWNSFALRVHARLGPLALLTAWTPAHSKPWTLTYRVKITEDGLRNLAEGHGGQATHRPVDEWLDSEDHEAMKQLQTRIETGESVWVAGSPQPLGPGRYRVPLSL